MKHIPVEGVNWTPSEVIKSATEQEFVDLHMSDPGTYAGLQPEKKEASLRMIYQLAGGTPSAATPTSDKEPPKKKVVKKDETQNGAE